MPVLLGALLRRWPLTLVLLLMSAGLGYAITIAVPPDYQAKATVLLVPPESQDQPDGNRYLLLGGLNPARDIVLRSLNSDAVRTEVLKGEPGASYDATQDFTTSTPFLVITTSAGTPGTAAGVLSDLVARVPGVLTTLQDQLDTRTNVRITALVVSQDDPKRVGKKQIRAVVAGVGAFLVVGVLLIGLLDRRWLNKRAARERAAAEADDDQPPEDDAQAGHEEAQPPAEPAPAQSVNSAKVDAGSQVGSRAPAGDPEPDPSRLQPVVRASHPAASPVKANGRRPRVGRTGRKGRP